MLSRVPAEQGSMLGGVGRMRYRLGVPNVWMQCDAGGQFDEGGATEARGSQLARNAQCIGAV